MSFVTFTKFSSELIFFTEEKTIHGLGEYSASEAVERFPEGCLGNSKFYRAPAEATHGWHGGQGFPYSYFLGLGKLKLTDWEDCDWC